MQKEWLPFSPNRMYSGLRSYERYSRVSFFLVRSNNEEFRANKKMFKPESLGRVEDTIYRLRQHGDEEQISNVLRRLFKFAQKNFEKNLKNENSLAGLRMYQERAINRKEMIRGNWRRSVLAEYRVDPKKIHRRVAPAASAPKSCIKLRKLA
jgi:hypothetical protein